MAPMISSPATRIIGATWKSRCHDAAGDRIMTRPWPRRTRLVFCDVDGTLVTRDKRLTPAVISAVEKLAAHGIAFTVASARPPFGLAHVVAPLKVTLPVSSFNGGLILQHGCPPIAEHLLAVDAAREAVDYFRSEKLEIWCFTQDKWLCTERRGSHMPLETRTIDHHPTWVDSFEPYLDRLGKIVAVSDDYDHLARCEKDGAARLGERASVARSQIYYLDVTHCNATKDRALRTVAHGLGIAIEDVVAIGDGHNDISMLKAAGFGIAMGNGSDSVRRAADHVTASNQEDGVARAIEDILANLDADRLV
jgi:Cof subfamily protein (haloacid dehalogenase superfamily)